MRSSASLLNAVTAVSHQSSSRIPHLRAHILARQPRPKLSSPKSCPTTERLRDFSSGGKGQNTDFNGLLGQPASQTSLSHQENRAQPSNTKDKNDDHVTSAGTDWALYNSSTAESDFSRKSFFQTSVTDQGRKSLADAFELAHGHHPDALLSALLRPVTGASFIQTADDEQFARVFSLITSDHFIEPFKHIHRFFRENAADVNGKHHFRSLQERLESLVTCQNHIIAQRQRFGHSLTLDVYRQLLDLARAMGDASIANHIFERMMPTDGVEPDLACYNHYMEALCWNHAYTPEERFHLRVLPPVLAIRGSKYPPEYLQGHRTAPPGKASPRRGEAIRVQVLNLFRQLVGNDIKGDEKTFTNLMVAMGREADVEGVKSILKSVWNIDVDLLRAYDEEEIESPTYYEMNSPLRPSDRLLFTVAHVFGSNNEAELALRLVDYISRNSNLTVPHYVWQHLCEWTMILALKRSKTGKKQLRDRGKVYPDVFERLWECMTDEPHNVKPDGVMLNMRTRLCVDRLNLNQTLKNLRKQRDLLNEARQDLHTLTQRMLSTCLALPKGANDPDGITSSSMPTNFLQLRREFLLTSLRVERDQQLILHSLRRILTRSGWNARGYRHQWTDRVISRIILEFADNLPNFVQYSIDSGQVELQLESTRIQALQSLGFADLRRTSSMLGRTLDTEDLTSMLRGIEELPNLMEESVKDFEQASFDEQRFKNSSS